MYVEWGLCGSPYMEMWDGAWKNVGFFDPICRAFFPQFNYTCNRMRSTTPASCYHMRSPYWGLTQRLAPSSKFFEGRLLTAAIVNCKLAPKCTCPGPPLCPFWRAEFAVVLWIRNQWHVEEGLQLPADFWDEACHSARSKVSGLALSIILAVHLLWAQHLLAESQSKVATRITAME